MLTILALAVLAFFVGSIPSGYIVGRLNGVDLRKHGSGNTGATNAGRILGKKAGLVTLGCDVVKGFIALMLAKLFPLDLPAYYTDSMFAATLGAIALFGHCYSPFLHFRGGKGVATGAGVFLALAPAQTSISLAIFVVCFKLFRYVSLASMVAAVSVPLLLVFSPEARDQSLAPFAALCSLLIVFRHRDNIVRLRNGSEPRYGVKPNA